MFALTDKLKEASLSYEKLKKKEIEDFLHMPIRETRMYLGFSYDQLAKALGCSKSEVISWEAEGESVPPLYQKYIKFLLKLREEGKLESLS